MVVRTDLRACVKCGVVCGNGGILDAHNTSPTALTTRSLNCTSLVIVPLFYHLTLTSPRLSAFPFLGHFVFNFILQSCRLCSKNLFDMRQFCFFFRHLSNIYNFQFLRDKKPQTNKQAREQRKKERSKQTNK